MEGRLHRIKDTLGRLIKASLILKDKSWASVASSSYEAAMVRSIDIPERAVVRVRLEDIKDKSSAELLSEAKKVIPGAFAVRQLRSGDIDVIILD